MIERLERFFQVFSPGGVLYFLGTLALRDKPWPWWVASLRQFRRLYLGLV